MALTAKQERFVAEYLIDLNATQAAIRAGYKEKSAYAVGAENLRKPQIAEAIAKAQAARSERTEVTMDWVVSQLAIEATREGEGASHTGRIAALRELRQHIASQDAGDEEAPSLTINFNTKAPVGDVRVTRSDD